LPGRGKAVVREGPGEGQSKLFQTGEQKKKKKNKKKKKQKKKKQKQKAIKKKIE